MSLKRLAGRVAVLTDGAVGSVGWVRYVEDGAKRKYSFQDMLVVAGALAWDARLNAPDVARQQQLYIEFCRLLGEDVIVPRLDALARR